MLPIQKYIVENGLEKTVTDFELNLRQNHDLILLKYGIFSPKGAAEVQNCRGIIMEKNTWDIVHLSFFRFFNFGESTAHNIDWESATVFEKLDGSLLSLYCYKDIWYVSTSGTIDAMCSVNNDESTTFASLFWRTLLSVTGKDKDEFTKLLDPDCCYMFELCTPYNIVVVPHTVSMLYLLAVRNKKTLKEIPYHKFEKLGLGVPIVKCISLSANIAELQSSLEDMPFTEEGYVICDKNFNRIKIKNPTYVSAHFLKGKSALHHIIEIIRANEVDEFAATFSERAPEIRSLEKEYIKLISLLDKIYETDLDCGKSVIDENSYKYSETNVHNRKNYAAKVFAVVAKYGLKLFEEFFFFIVDGKKESAQHYMDTYNEKNKHRDKELYKYLAAKANIKKSSGIEQI